MRLYESDGKAYAVFEETIELCDFNSMDTLQKCKEKLLEKVADGFERMALKAVLSGSEENGATPASLRVGLPETVTGNAKNVMDAPETVIDNAKNVMDAPETVIDNAKNVMDAPETVADNAKIVAASSKNVSETGKPKRKGRKGIDAGKIMALKNAGWTNKEIAAEMKMEPQSVANVVYRHRKKNEVTG